MFKKYLQKVIFLTVLMLFASISSCLCASGADITVQYDRNNMDRVVISGNTGLSGLTGDITLSVFFDNNSYAGLTDETEASDKLAYFQTASVKTDGSFEFYWVPEDTDVYDLYIGYFGWLQPEQKQDVFVAAKRSVLYAILESGSLSDIENMLSVDTNFKALFSTIEDSENVTDTDTLSKILYSIRTDLPNEKINDCFSLAIRMTLLSQNADAESLEYILSELENISFALNGFDEYKTYEDDVLNQTLAAKLAPEMSKGVGNLNSIFKKCLVVSGIEASQSWTAAKPFVLMTGKSLDSNELYDICVSVYGKTYTYTELIDKIDELSGEETIYQGGSAPAIIAVNKNSNEDTTEDSENYEMDTSEKITFTDVSVSHWAFNEINELRWKNYIDGYQDGSFRPDNEITRAEAVTLICKALRLDTDEVLPAERFTDVSDSAWYNKYVYAAQALDIVNGYDLLFKPEDIITRQDMAVIIYNTAKHLNVQCEASQAVYADNNLIADYATEAVYKLTGAEILNGTGENQFTPYGNVTRAQAAAMIYRLLKMTGGF